MKEKYIQNVIMDWLAAEHILAFRMQVGGMPGEYQGKRRFTRFGTIGMADVLAFPSVSSDCVGIDSLGGKLKVVQPTWIECKAPKGKQSEFQKSFQGQVEREGHKYILARSLDDVIRALGKEPQ